MYYQNYEDYMRSVLGYPMENTNTYNIYENSNYSMPVDMRMYPQTNMDISMNNAEIEDMYPDIYKIINPMVDKICEANTIPITKELVDKMAEEIYMNIEADMTIGAVINVNVEASGQIDNRKLDYRNQKNSNREEISEVRQTRQPVRNSLLNDLIKILILNRLLGRPGHRPPRPPFPPPPRPPFPGPGPMPPPRPPYPGPTPRPPFPGSTMRD